MPPRKKATAADGTAAPPTRSSARIKASAAAAPATTATTAPTTTTAAKKPASKRARANSQTDKDGGADSKPASKKAKTSQAADVQQDDNKKDDTQKDDTVDKADAKMVTVIKRGAAPVDPVSGKVATHQVYSNNEAVWDAMLNQTDVRNNANKFYVIQLLHPIGNEGNCILYTRWGRVGENGQSQVKGPWASSIAVGEFKKQFKSKTGVAWESRVGMVPKTGKYTWLERDFADGDDPKGNENASGSKTEEKPVPDSSLAPEIQDLCRLIFSTSLIDAHLSSMNYDAKKLPLGKLAKSTILNGFSALKRLAEVIEQPNGDMAKEYGGFRTACEQLSGAYYSIIPHDFGRQRPLVIDDAALLKRELDLVDALGDMEIASKLISSNPLEDEQGNRINPLDANFRSLGLTSMEPVKRETTEFEALAKYVQDTHGATHHIQVSVTNAYRVERSGETEAWTNAGFDNLGDGERMLLWHGSRTTNFAGILKQGLRIAPPEAPVTGYMFGKGVYFADMMSKSANYCHAYLSNNTGLLLLCEVAVKPFYERTHAEYDADRNCKKSNKMATKGIGRTQPVVWKDAGRALNNDDLVGCHMPDGAGQDVSPPNAYLQYNEYIVYDSAQIRLKYLLMVKM